MEITRPSFEIVSGEALEVLSGLEDKRFQCAITSPPYYGLRDYKVENQVGMEKTPDLYVKRLVGIFREVRRVLRNDGILWIVIGDSYAGSWKNQSRKPERGTQRSINGGMLTPVLDGRYPDMKQTQTGKIPAGADYKPKDLLGIPWMLAFALRADGWWLRDAIVWSKPNPMPSSVTDRCTSSYEMVFMLAKSKRYRYDNYAVREPSLSGDTRRPHGRGQASIGGRPASGARNGDHRDNSEYANKRNVWTVASHGFSWKKYDPDSEIDHFAVYPPALVTPMVLASTSPYACGQCGTPYQRVIERKGMEVTASPRREAARESADGLGGDRMIVSGTMTSPPTMRSLGFAPKCKCEIDPTGRCEVLDPFCGSGTTGSVALENGHDFYGIDLNEDYVGMARRRIGIDVPRAVEKVAEKAKWPR